MTASADNYTRENVARQRAQYEVDTGTSPIGALVAATAHGARVIRQENERETLAPGKRADLLVLDANPLDDIRRTTRLSAAWHGGKRVLPTPP